MTLSPSKKPALLPVLTNPNIMNENTEKAMSTLAVSEAFYSIQGEGQTQGSPSFFLRLAGCNLMCGGHGTEKTGQLYGATWRCDSIEVWMKGKKKPFPDVVEMLGGQKFLDRVKEGAHLVITGGEPLLQMHQIARFLMFLNDEHKVFPFVEIETNGTIEPSEYLIKVVNQWNCSPKLFNSGMSFTERVNSKAICKISSARNKAIFKFVISSEEDWQEVCKTYLAWGFIKRPQIWLMPATDTMETFSKVAQVVAEICKKNTVQFSSRTHICIWDKKTGV